VQSAGPFADSGADGPDHPGRARLLDRARFEHQVAALSTGRPVYWISAETRTDPADPRLHLATCVNGTVGAQQALARYQSHGAWLEWTHQASGP
jgi:hypothetical protein